MIDSAQNRINRPEIEPGEVYLEKVHNLSGESIRREMTKELIQKHVQSFLKTYIVAFLTVALYAYDQQTDIFTVEFVTDASKTSLMVVARNVYKLLTEDI